MEHSNGTNKTFQLICYLLFLSFITGLIFSFRAVSSISTGGLLFTGLIFNRSFFHSLWEEKNILFFISVSLLFSLMPVISLFYTGNQEKSISDAIIQSSVFLTPIAIYSTGYLNSNTTKKILEAFCVLLVLASLYCLANAIADYQHSGDSSIFFYHRLVHPIRHHAVYFSILVFMAIVFCGESIIENNTRKKWLYIVAALFFSAMLFLLSSKLVIAFFVIYLFYFLIIFFKKGKVQWKAWLSVVILIVLTTCLALFTKNPVSNRFADLLEGETNTLNKDQYSADDYFNGLQFRLLQWKLVPEILNENKAWVAGVSPGDAQAKLNEKYISKKMYAGDPQHNDPGYLLYNTHNQFLQSLLENGIIGLMIFIFYFFSIIKMTWQDKKPKGMAFVILLLLAFAFTESVLKTQYGIIIFSFLPLLVYKRS